MTTRNQKRRANANQKPTSSISEGVDFEKVPVVALPASNLINSHSELNRNREANPNSNGNQLGSSNLVNSSTAVASAEILKNPSSSPAIPATPVVKGNCDANLNSYGNQPDPLKTSSSAATLKNPSSPAPSTPVTAAAERPVITTTSNPVLRDICDLKSGELKIVSPAVSKYFGFPAGPVENLNFNDPKVAEFFNVTVTQPAAAAIDAVPVMSSSVQDAREGTAALVPVSGPVPIQSPIAATVSPISAAPLIPQTVLEPAATTQDALLQQGPSNVAGKMVNAGGSARPAPMAAEKPQTPSSWAGLFKNNRATNDDTKMNPNFTGVTADDVEWIDDDLEDEGEEKRSLIGFFNGKFPGIKAIQHIVDSWSRKCTFEHHNSGWLVFEFEEEVDCDVVLKEGPYYAFNKPLVLKKMPEYFDFSDDAYSTAPVWIQLPNLPLRAWKKSALEKICTFLGTPLHIDQVTKDKTKKSFARCLVEVDVSKDLPNVVCCKFPGGKVLRQHVLYEETPTFCTNCKKLGHETEDCYVKNNGKPSLYVTRSKKEREKMAGNNSNKVGVANGAARGYGKQPNPAQAARNVSAAARTAQPADIGASLAANSGQVHETAAAKTLEGTTVARQPSTTHYAPNLNNSKAMAMTNKNGKALESNAKVPGHVSTNSFGILANEKVGSWAEEAEASNARNNNKQKKLNGRGK